MSTPATKDARARKSASSSSDKREERIRTCSSRQIRFFSRRRSSSVAVGSSGRATDRGTAGESESSGDEEDTMVVRSDEWCCVMVGVVDVCADGVADSWGACFNTNRNIFEIFF